MFQLLDPDAVLVDPPLDLPIRRATNTHANRQAAAMTRQADHPHVMAEVLTTELRAQRHVARQVQYLRLKLQIAKGAPIWTASCGQVIQFLGRGFS